MKDNMQAVAKVWYRLYFGVILLYCVGVMVLCIAVRLTPGLHGLEQTLALNQVTLILSAVATVYGASIFWLIARRAIPLATLAYAMLLTLLLLNGLVRTDGSAGAWLYILGWLMSTAFVGMFGLQMLLASLLLTVTYVLLTNNFQLGTVSQLSWILVTGTILCATVGYAFWRRIFIDTQDQELSQLTGALRSNQEQSAILIQSIADGVIVINNEGKISLMNAAAAAMTEWKVSEAGGIDVQLVVKLTSENGAALPADQNPFAQVLTRKVRVEQTMQLVGQHGRKQIVSVVISPVAVPGGGVAGAVAVIRDVSQTRAAEQQRAEFISTASHEMRTPVAAIEGYLALALNEKVSTIDSRARGYLEKAHASTQHLGQLFQDLLTSAKAEDGRLSNHPVVIEMGSFLEQLVDDLRFGAQKKGLGAEFVVGTSGAGGTIDATTDQDSEAKKVIKPLYYVWADPDRMREVITNIFDNAVKYTDQGKVSLGLTGNNDIVQLYVRDTGPGIPAEDIPHLFQKFYRVDNSATRTIGGTGLGLFICRKIVELYQGRLWVESKLGQGSTFFINLPRLDTQKAQQLQQQSAAGETPVA